MSSNKYQKGPLGVVGHAGVAHLCSQMSNYLGPLTHPDAWPRISDKLQRAPSQLYRSQLLQPHYRIAKNAVATLCCNIVLQNCVTTLRCTGVALWLKNECQNELKENTAADADADAAADDGTDSKEKKYEALKINARSVS